jgi:kynureninase
VPVARSPVTRQDCLDADAADPLAPFRSRFALPDGRIYLDGNSLGAMPVAAAERAHDVVHREWADELIASWNTNDWFALPVRIGDKIASLLGGERGGCVATDTTSINLFKALGAALRLQREDAPARRVIVTERENFPTDLYVVEGLIDLLGGDHEVRLIDGPDELDAALGDDVAVVLLTQVNYRTGALWDMAATTARIHATGALVVWDLCHSAGALPVHLDRDAADFAVGCTYKYLNGGPGSPAFVWVAERHRDRAVSPLTGWWGHARPFDMSPAFERAAGIRGFLVGTQPILSLATMEAGIDLALEADRDEVRRKSLALTGLFMRLIDERVSGGHALDLLTPRDERRGSQLSYRHPEGFAIVNALISLGVVGDYREPGVLRFGFAPLYTGYADVWDSVEAVRRVLDDGLWRDERFRQRGAVT